MRGVSVDLVSPPATKCAIKFNLYYDNKPNGDLHIILKGQLSLLKARNHNIR